jgi:V/A-type H+-transporting ATPase subunit I
MGMVGGTLFGINLIDSGYTLTSNSFETLRHEVPVDITDKIASLEGIHFKKKDDFLRGISESAGVLAVNEHQTVFLKAAESDYPVLSSFRYMLLDSNKLMILALVLGYIQVLFGMFLKAANRIRMFGVKYAISQFGWITIVAISVPAYGLGYLDMIPAGPANQVALISFIAGMIPALFYNSPGKNPFLNFGVGLWNTYQTASGLLGDVLSYIRLFALGISSAILGNVFNTLAFELSPDPKYIILRQLVIVLILLFGHSLNFFMAALGSFVHPLRLTFVEFYKNADFAGGGNKYEPFRT